MKKLMLGATAALVLLLVLPLLGTAVLLSASSRSRRPGRLVHQRGHAGHRARGAPRCNRPTPSPPGSGHEPTRSPAPPRTTPAWTWLLCLGPARWWPPPRAPSPSGPTPTGTAPTSPSSTVAASPPATGTWPPSPPGSRTGTTVWMGQQLGVEGSTGHSTGDPPALRGPPGRHPDRPRRVHARARCTRWTARPSPPSSPPGTGPSRPRRAARRDRVRPARAGHAPAELGVQPAAADPRADQGLLPGRGRAVSAALDRAGRHRHGRDRPRPQPAPPAAPGRRG